MVSILWRVADERSESVNKLWRDFFSPSFIFVVRFNSRQTIHCHYMAAHKRDSFHRLIQRSDDEGKKKLKKVSNNCLKFLHLFLAFNSRTLRLQQHFVLNEGLMAGRFFIHSPCLLHLTDQANWIKRSLFVFMSQIQLFWVFSLVFFFSFFSWCTRRRVKSSCNWSDCGNQNETNSQVETVETQCEEEKKKTELTKGKNALLPRWFYYFYRSLPDCQKKFN